MRGLIYLFSVFIFNISSLGIKSNTFEDKIHGENGDSHVNNGSFVLVPVNFSRVAIPYTILIWILLVCLTVTILQFTGKLPQILPESCILIIMGLPIGALLRYTVIPNYFQFNPDLFFLFLLPPIVFDAGYFVKTKAFFENIVPILSHAVFGTIFNTFAVGIVLKLSDPIFIFKNLKWADYFQFGALISAVDPVAVLAVFHELQVHQVLFIIVFGESLLNDAVTVVLYNLFDQFTTIPNITYRELLLGFASFFTVSGCGVLIGVVFAIIVSLITRITYKFRICEPVLILAVPYLAYLTAEIFHFSGIMSIMFCAITMKPYVEANIAYKSKITVRKIIHTLSHICEAIIFMFLGASLFDVQLKWDTGFVLITLASIIIFRIISVMFISLITNQCKLREKISWVEQFIMMYGGLRGAVSFSLALILNADKNEHRDVFITATIVVVLFTVFIQGVTIKPLVRFLKVKIEKEVSKKMLEQLNFRLINHFNVGMEAIIGVKYFGYIHQSMKNIERNYINKILINKNELKRKNELLDVNKKILYKQAAELVENNPSALFNIKMGSFMHNPEFFNKEKDEVLPDLKAFKKYNVNENKRGEKLFKTILNNPNQNTIIDIKSRTDFMNKDIEFDYIPYRFSRQPETLKLKHTSKLSDHNLKLLDDHIHLDDNNIILENERSLLFHHKLNIDETTPSARSIQPELLDIPIFQIESKNNNNKQLKSISELSASKPTIDDRKSLHPNH